MKKFYISKKDGFMSIQAILWMSFLLPFLLFVTIDFSHFMHQNSRLKNITDNASASAVTMLNKDKIPQGILEVNKNDATAIVKNIIQTNLSLNTDMTPTSSSPLAKAPTIDVQVINEVPSAGVDVTTPAGNIRVYKPSVVTYVKYPVKGLFYSGLVVDMQKVGVSQVQFK